MAESDEQKVHEVAALAARAQDSALPIPERVASLNELVPLLRAASRGENAAAVAEKLLDLEHVDFACRDALLDTGAYIMHMLRKQTFTLARAQTHNHTNMYVPWHRNPRRS